MYGHFLAPVLVSARMRALSLSGDVLPQNPPYNCSSNSNSMPHITLGLVDIRSGNVLIENCDIFSGADGIRVHKDANPTIVKNSIHDAHQGGDGIYFGENSKGTVMENEIFNNRMNGVHVNGIPRSRPFRRTCVRRCLPWEQPAQPFPMIFHLLAVVFAPSLLLSAVVSSTTPAPPPAGSAANAAAATAPASGTTTAAAATAPASGAAHGLLLLLLMVLLLLLLLSTVAVAVAAAPPAAARRLYTVSAQRHTLPLVTKGVYSIRDSGPGLVLTTHHHWGALAGGAAPPLDPQGGPKGTRIFFCSRPLLGTAPRDHQPPTTNRDQPPTATNR